MVKSRDPPKTGLKITLLTASVMTIFGGLFLSPALPAIRTQYGDLANNETPAAFRGRVLGGFTTALFSGQFVSPILSSR